MTKNYFDQCASLDEARSVSGEESPAQIKLRAKRLGMNDDNFFLLCEPDLRAAIEAVDEIKPGLLIVDSIQTL